MLPNFQIWVMVVSHSPLGFVGVFFADTAPWCWFSLCVAGFRVRDASEYIVYIRTQTRPAIEFVSGEDGLRPLRVRLQGRSELRIRRARCGTRPIFSLQSI